MAGNPLTDPRWAADLADRIEQIVGNLREKTTVPLVRLARALVFGLLAAFLAVTALVLAVVGATRGLQALFDLVVARSQAVYLSYFVVGGILCVVGWLVLRMRPPRNA